MAAEAAFWLFLSLIPLAAVAGLLAARLSLRNWGYVDPLLASLPPGTRDLVASELERVSTWNGGAVGLTGALTFLWLASSGMHALLETLTVQAGTPRPWWQKRLLSIATCAGLSLAVAALAILGPGLEGAWNDVAGFVPGWPVLGEPTFLGRLVRIGASLAVMFAYTSGLYWVGTPRRARRSVRVLPGAVVAVAIQAASSLGLQVFVSARDDGTVTSTGLALIGITLLALYLFSFALLAGAVVNQKVAGPPSASEASDLAPGRL